MDVGANVGMFVLQCQRKLLQACNRPQVRASTPAVDKAPLLETKIVAFEPSPVTFVALARNVARHQTAGARVRAALHPKPPSLQVFDGHLCCGRVRLAGAFRLSVPQCIREQARAPLRTTLQCLVIPR